MRYEVSIKVQVEAMSLLEAKALMQKLVDVINSKDPKNKAWIPKVSERKGEEDE